MSEEKIVAVKRDNCNRIVEFKTNKNNIYNYEMAKEAIISGEISNASLLKDENDLIHIVNLNSKSIKNQFEKMEEFK